jgi:hypothetical protein
MIEGQDLYVEVVGWGYHSSPKVVAGDKRIQIKFPMEFVKPVGVTIPVYFFKLRLKDRSGRLLAESTESTVYNNQPLPVTAGMYIDLVWDLALEKVSPELQSMILPGIRGKVVSKIQNGQLVSQ